MKAPPYFRPRWPWITADLQTIRNVLPGRLSGIPPNSGQRFEIPLRDGTGDRLAARFHKGRKPVPTVVLVSGLAGCEASRYVLQSAGAWLASGAPVARLNLSASPPGRSVARGHHNMDRVRDLADACLAVADLDPGVRDRGIAIVGFSLGGALALRLAAAPYLQAVEERASEAFLAECGGHSSNGRFEVMMVETSRKCGLKVYRACHDPRLPIQFLPWVFRHC